MDVTRKVLLGLPTVIEVIKRRKENDHDYWLQCTGEIDLRPEFAAMGLSVETSRGRLPFGCNYPIVYFIKAL